jgi:hypothetical protein
MMLQVRRFWQNTNLITKFWMIFGTLLALGALGLWFAWRAGMTPIARPLPNDAQQTASKTESPSQAVSNSSKPGTSSPTPATNTSKPASNNATPPQPTPPPGGGGSSGGGSTGACPLPAYPDATCTGVPAGTSLTIVNGNMTINTAGTVVDSKDIRGCVTVNAASVVIRKSKIACNGPYVIDAYGVSGTWLRIEDSEVSCNNTNGTAIGEENITVLRTNIHGCENGFDVNFNFLIQDNYIHDMYQSAVAHTDGIQMWPSANDVTIKHNRIYANDGTSAIISAGSGTSNILIQDNLFAGGAYTLYCRQNGPGTNYRVINNHFSTIFYPTVGAYGPWTDCDDEAQVTGNVYHETGLPVPF